MANTKVKAEQLEAAQTNITSLGTLTALTVDDITIDGSTISDGGDLTIDVTGNLILDADGGEFKFRDGGTDFARIFQSSGNFYLNVPTQDTDLIIQGNDGGSNVNALTFDMSAKGAATFNEDATVTLQGTHNEGGGLLFIKGTDTAAASKNLGSLCFGNPSDACLAMIRGVSTDTTAADLRFYTEAQGAAIEERMRIDSSGNVGIGVSPNYGKVNITTTGTGAQDRALWVECSPASSGSNNNAMVINVGNANMTNTVMRIHHESPAANQKLLSLDTTGSNTEKFWVDEDGDGYFAGIVTKPGQPSFLARASANNGLNATSTAYTVRYGGHSVLHNIGSHFDASDYKFTAPITGSYFFSANLRVDGFSGGYSYLTLKHYSSTDVLQSDKGRDLQDGNNSTYLNHIVTAVVYLAVGDYVYLNYISNGDSSVNLSDDSWFSGYLLG